MTAAVVAGVAIAGARGSVALADATPATPTAVAAALAAEAPPTEEAIVVVSPSAADESTSVGATRRRLRSAAEDAGVEITSDVPEIGVATVDLPDSTSVAELRSELADSDDVVAVEPNLQLELRFANDPAVSRSDPAAPAGDVYQWYLRKSRFNRAWKRSRGRRAEVAVIDTGADASHPDLRPRIAAAFDHDGWPLHGPADRDENGHGSHVAGVACGNSNDGYGIASAGFRCNLVIYKSDLTPGSISRSIVDAANRGVDVINMSFGGSGSSQTLERAIDHAYDREVVLIAAASNESETDQGIPARYVQPSGTGPRIRAGKGLVVTAAQYDGARAWFGPGRGTGISLAAYGAASRDHRGIFSSFPRRPTEIETLDPMEPEQPPCVTCRGQLGEDERFAYLEGTSMAAPQVAGAAALLRHRRPQLPARRIVTIIKRTASRDDGYSDSLGWGVVNANKALRKTLRATRKRK